MPVFANATDSKKSIYKQILDVLNQIFGKQPGYRYIHAKGIICEGRFFPGNNALSLSRAQIFRSASTPLIIRFSNFSGVPTVPDNDPAASPRGMAIRFTLPDGKVMDIMTHSYNGFPASTVEEFLQFIQALAASSSESPKPTPIENFLSGHPRARQFANDPKPVPISFATQSYYGVDTFLLVNDQGEVSSTRYCIHPLAGEQYLNSNDAAEKPADFLFDELRERLALGSVLFRLIAQIPERDDPIDDPAATWPEDRKKVELGIIAVDTIHIDSDSTQRSISFDPTNLVDGIEISGDHLPLDRSALYAIAFDHRKA